MTSGHGNGGEARAKVRTALGDFAVVASARGLSSVTPLSPGASEHAGRAGDVVGHHPGAHAGAEAATDAAAARHVCAAAEALQRYADGDAAPYDGLLDLTAPAFHRAVWDRLRAIPFGATTSYGEIARALGMPGEARAVGAAVAANPICVLVPCHRVVGADGSLRGFAWGLELKRRLLAHEGRAALPLFAAERSTAAT